MEEFEKFVKWIRKKKKHVTTTCHGGGNKFPWGLCYNYISDFIARNRVKVVYRL